ncbi:hypothetical protein A2U01_0083927, partial [Trifolium medium]|nr:hypothetical protein [Trifolium medium]
MLEPRSSNASSMVIPFMEQGMVNFPGSGSFGGSFFRNSLSGSSSISSKNAL